jgi:hypothetical protein
MIRYTYMHIFQNLFSFEISEMAESKLYINYQQLYMSFTKVLIISCMLIKNPRGDSRELSKTYRSTGVKRWGKTQI